MRDASYSKDPRWIAARFLSTCKRCSRKISNGEQVLYYPINKIVLCDSEDCGKQSWSEFRSAVADEDFMNSGF